MMSQHSSLDADTWIGKTRLIQAWQHRQREIQEHKWYESEKAGRDIGWERATVSYTLWQANGNRN